MAGFEHIQQLMMEVGPLLDPLEIRWYEAETTWLMVLSAETQIEIAYDAALNRVVLTVDLGTPHDGGDEALWRLLLRVGYLWRDNGGLRMALDGEDQVAMLFEHPVDSLDIGQWQVILTNFADQAARWRELLQKPSGPSGGR